MAWTTDDLVELARREAWLPDADDLTSANILDFGNGELRGDTGKVMKVAREEHAVMVEDLTLVSGTTNYRLPRRSQARGIRAITFVDSSGRERPSTELPLAEAYAYGTSYVAGLFFLRGDSLVLPCAPTESGAKYRVQYIRRASRMVPVSSGAIIERAVSTTRLELATTTPGASISTADALLDIVRGDSPFDLSYTDLLSDGMNPGGAGANILGLDSTTPIVVADVSTGTQIGARDDYVCPRDTTVYPPLPEELHEALGISIAARILESRNDPRAIEKRNSAIRALRSARALLEPRHLDRKPAIIPQGSPLRAGRRVFYS